MRQPTVMEISLLEQQARLKREHEERTKGNPNTFNYTQYVNVTSALQILKEARATGRPCRLPECDAPCSSLEGYCLVHQRNLDSWRKA